MEKIVLIVVTLIMVLFILFSLFAIVSYYILSCKYKGEGRVEKNYHANMKLTYWFVCFISTVAITTFFIFLFFDSFLSLLK